MTEADKSRQKLNVKQRNAIDLLLQGKRDREVAEIVGVVRQTITEWRNNNPNFVAELNRRRYEIWGAHNERLRTLIAEAVETLEACIHSENERTRLAAAVHVLRSVGLYGTNLKPTGETDSEDIIAGWRKEEEIKFLIRSL